MKDENTFILHPSDMANIKFLGFGTRGDVQPVVALARGLQQAGHRVTVVAGDNFGDWVRSQGVEFFPIGTDIQAMMQSKEGIAWVEGSQFTQQIHMKRLFGGVAEAMRQKVWECSADADWLIGSFTSDGIGMAVAEKRNIGYATLGLQPLRPTRVGTSTYMSPVPKGESIFNQWSGKFGEYALWSVFAKSLNQCRRELGFAPHTFKSYTQAQHALPAVHGYSQHVAPKPADWAKHWHITGYWFLDPPVSAGHASTAHFSPELQQFLKAGPPPIYIGFGSATDRNAKATTQLIMRAIQISGQRAVVAHGWAGLTANELSALPKAQVCTIGNVSHAQLFPLMAGVVHHGGAGTTGTAFAAGVPQFVIPHFAEQPYWGRRTYELGVGVKPVPKQRLSDADLAKGMTQMATDQQLKDKAAQLGELIRAEDGINRAVHLINDIIAKA